MKLQEFRAMEDADTRTGLKHFVGNVKCPSESESNRREVRDRKKRKTSFRLPRRGSKVFETEVREDVLASSKSNGFCGEIREFFFLHLILMEYLAYYGNYGIIQVKLDLVTQM